MELETQIPSSLLSRAPAFMCSRVHGHCQHAHNCKHARAHTRTTRHNTSAGLVLIPGLFLFHSRLAKRMRSTLPSPAPIAVNHSSYGLNKLWLTLEILRSAARLPSLFPQWLEKNQKKNLPFRSTRLPSWQYTSTPVEGPANTHGRKSWVMDRMRKRSCGAHRHARSYITQH